MESLKKKAKRAPPRPSPTADGAGGADRISALDDDLCELILRLAHLDVRELVRTSVLSKRWRGLWKRLPVLDFFGWPVLESARDVRQYIAIVNDVLEQRAGATSEARIEELKIPLVFTARGQRHQLWTAAKKAAEAWIRYAMHQQVKGLQLNLRLPPLLLDERIKLKNSVIDLDEHLPSSPKLEYLRLGLGHTEVLLPRTAVFTSLKDLALNFAQLAGGSRRHLARLSSLACCPSLQKLRMKHISFVSAGTKELVLDAGELLELSMDSVCGVELLELRTPKLLYLKIKDCKDIKLTVSAPGLNKLTYFRNGGLVHGPLLCVWRLDIDLITHKGEDDYDTRFHQNSSNTNISLLKRCSTSLRCLLVHLYVPLVEEQHIDLIKDKIPQLPNVTSLLISIDVECQRHSFGDGVASLLTRFKNLEYLSLQLDDSPNICLKKDEYYSKDDVDSAFTCNHLDHWESIDISLANLHEVDFRGMTGTDCELRFLRFVLASATDLRSVTVRFNLYFIKEVQNSRMHYFLHRLLGDGTWTSCENEDQDFNKPYKKCSKLYKWTPSP